MKNMHLRSNSSTKLNFDSKEKTLRQTRLVFKIVKDPLRHWISTNTKITSSRTSINNLHKLKRSIVEKHEVDKNCPINLSRNIKSSNSFKKKNEYKQYDIKSTNCKLCNKKYMRPKRIIIPKKSEPLLGISWKEESQLNKALYASLQESKLLKGSFLENDSVSNVDLLCNGEKFSYVKDSHFFNPNLIKKESIIDSPSDNSYPIIKVKAQRKFAEGFRGVSVLPMPKKIVCLTPPIHIQFPEDVPSTNDFIQFLILRGSDKMPSNLEHFNFPSSSYPVLQTSNEIEIKSKKMNTKRCTSQSQSFKQTHNQIDLKKTKITVKPLFNKQNTKSSKQKLLFHCSTNTVMSNIRRRNNKTLKTSLLKSRNNIADKKLRHKQINIPDLTNPPRIPSMRDLLNQIPSLSKFRPNTRSLMAAKHQFQLIQAQMANK